MSMPPRRSRSQVDAVPTLTGTPGPKPGPGAARPDPELAGLRLCLYGLLAASLVLGVGRDAGQGVLVAAVCLAGLAASRR